MTQFEKLTLDALKELKTKTSNDDGSEKVIQC
jgi:hypothetical protein